MHACLPESVSFIYFILMAFVYDETTEFEFSELQLDRFRLPYSEHLGLVQ